MSETTPLIAVATSEGSAAAGTPERRDSGTERQVELEVVVEHEDKRQEKWLPPNWHLVTSLIVHILVLWLVAEYYNKCPFDTTIPLITLIYGCVTLVQITVNTFCHAALQLGWLSEDNFRTTTCLNWLSVGIDLLRVLIINCGLVNLIAIQNLVPLFNTATDSAEDQYCAPQLYFVFVYGTILLTISSVTQLVSLLYRNFPKISRLICN